MDDSQGVPNATIRESRAIGVRIRLDIHFIHVRSKHEGVLTPIIRHGWPGSIIERMRSIDRLTDPTAHGGSASDAFGVVISSLPGYGSSGEPTSTGWGPSNMHAHG